jgi:cytochrome b involved in lipid metabolism
MMDNDHRSLGEASAMHARNVLSKMRSAVRTPIRNDYRIGRSLLASSPGRRQQESSGVYLDQEDSLFGAQPLPPPTTTTTTPPELAYDAHGGGGGGDARSRYKVLGMMEELKMKEKETNLLRRELNEMELNHEKEALKHEKEALLYHRELTQMQMKQEELLDQETSQLQRNMNEMRRKQEELREKEKAQLRREMAEMQSTHENESALNKEPTYTMSKLRRHNDAESAWFLVGRTIYDVTSYVRSHPGGMETILRKSGGVADCTEDFRFHSKRAQNEWRRHKVGILRDF